MPRFFVPAAQIQGTTAVIGGRDAEHVARSLRMRPGETVVVVEEGRREHGVVLESVSPQGVGGRVVWSRDVTEDSRVVRADVARQVGLKAGIAIPVRAGHDLVAVLEFFVFDPREQDDRRHDTDLNPDRQQKPCSVDHGRHQYTPLHVLGIRQHADRRQGDERRGSGIEHLRRSRPA